MPPIETDHLKQKFANGRFLEIINASKDWNTPDPVTTNILASAFAGLGAFEQAIQNLAKLVTHEPDYIAAKHNLALTYLRADQPQKASALFKEIIEKEPNFLEAQHGLAASLAQTGKLTDASKIQKQLCEADPQNIPYQKNLSEFLAALGDWEAVDQILDRIIASDPTDADALIMRASSLLHKQRYADAQAVLRNAKDLDPDNPTLYRCLGQLWFALQDYKKAIDATLLGLQRSPSDADAYAFLGYCFLQTGQKQNAKQALRSALKYRPAHAEAQHFLNVLENNQDVAAEEHYVKNLFNSYATRFEQSLVDELGYNLPNEIPNLLQREMGTALSDAKILDMGCGTGLVGSNLASKVAAIDGFDLSERMVDLAKEKSVYRSLSVASIDEYLSKKIDAYDVFIAADVFVYLGDLTSTFKALRNSAKKNALFLFSTEEFDGAGYTARTSGRYAHSHDYIENLATASGFKVIHQETVGLRREGHAVLAGGVYILRTT